ncbi:LysR family transcriptional regulator [Subtercola endophyticus]|uniref:LysR family transcriptional regulator n=1 Tax=Subtercola endophyticus TaxID=2895559 RepID=UPI001E4E782C|nr:LysR family transcriptional regulator [Subtercola endophyticus]UFS58792.1 LysR family transcriptional regulator [Subtercola endophyticus]
MDVRHLRHFLAVAETLNYTRAAENLVMAASPLSRSIQQLELEIGGTLFARGTRKVELTPLGIALVPYAEKTLADLDALRREMTRRLQGHREFDVGLRSLPLELTNAFIADVVKAVEPEAVVRLHPLESYAQMERILNGRLAFGLVNRRVDDRRLEYWELLRETPAIALPDIPRFSELTEVTPHDLVGIRLLMQPGAGSFSPETQLFADAAAELVPVEAEIVGGLSAMISAGDSCCLTLANPSSPWHKYLSGDGVVIRPLAGVPAKASTYLTWRTDRDVEADLTPVIEAAREYFAEPWEF